ncbi:hypothetical protein, partial [Salmonella enterica]
YAPVRARLVREPYRRIRKTSGYAGGYLLCSILANCLSFQHENLMHINFGMTNAPFMLFSYQKLILINVTCC